jgi:hypothetical protein
VPRSGGTISLDFEWMNWTLKWNDGEDVPNEIIIEWCTDDAFRESSTTSLFGRLNVSSSETSVRVTLNRSQINPVETVIYMRLFSLRYTEQNIAQRSQEASPTSFAWKIASSCNDFQYLNNLNQSSPSTWSCEDCPEGASCRAECPRGASSCDEIKFKDSVRTEGRKHVARDDVIAKEGYWRVFPKHDRARQLLFEPCFFGPACVGWNIAGSSLSQSAAHNATSHHKEHCNVSIGHRSLCNFSGAHDKAEENGDYRCRLCATCAEGYQHLFGRQDCSPCPIMDSKDAILQFVLIGALFLIFVALFVVLVFCRTRSRGRKSVSSGVRKLLINYLQISSLSLAWGVPWPDSITWMLVVQGSISTLSDSTISLTCALGSWTPFEVMQATQIMWSFMPFVFVAIITATYGAFVLLIAPKRCSHSSDEPPPHWYSPWFRRKGVLQSPHDNYIMSVVYGLYLMYPVLCRSGFALLQCVELNKVSYLRQDMQIECFGKEHGPWVGLLAVPQLLGFVLGLPMAGLIALRSNKKALFDSRRSKHRWAMVRFGLLFDGYRQEAWWFEAVVACRKAGFVAMALLTQGSDQVHVAIGFLAGNIALNVMIRPFGQGSAGGQAKKNDVGKQKKKNDNDEEKNYIMSGDTKVVLKENPLLKMALRDSTKSIGSVVSSTSDMLSVDSQRDLRRRADSTMPANAINRYDHSLLHHMDIYAMLTALALAWSGLFFLHQKSNRIKDNLVQETEFTHTPAEHVLGGFILLLNIYFFAWALRQFFVRWFVEHKRHVDRVKRITQRMRRRASLDGPDDDKNKRFSSFFRKSPIRTKGKSGKAGGSGGATSPRSSSRLRDNPIGQRVATVGDKAGVLTTAQEGSKKSTLTVKNTIDVDAARAVELTLRPKMIASSEGADRGGSAGKEMKKRGSKTTHVRERSLKLMKKMEQELEKTSVSVPAAGAGGGGGGGGAAAAVADQVGSSLLAGSGDVEDWSKPYVDESSGRKYVFSPSRNKTKWLHPGR